MVYPNGEDILHEEPPLVLDYRRHSDIFNLCYDICFKCCVKFGISVNILYSAMYYVHRFMYEHFCGGAALQYLTLTDSSKGKRWREKNDLTVESGVKQIINSETAPVSNEVLNSDFCEYQTVSSDKEDILDVNNQTSKESPMCLEPSESPVTCSRNELSYDESLNPVARVHPIALAAAAMILATKTEGPESRSSQSYAQPEYIISFILEDENCSLPQKRDPKVTSSSSSLRNTHESRPKPNPGYLKMVVDIEMMIIATIGSDFIFVNPRSKIMKLCNTCNLGKYVEDRCERILNLVIRTPLILYVDYEQIALAIVYIATRGGKAGKIGNANDDLSANAVEREEVDKEIVKGREGHCLREENLQATEVALIESCLATNRPSKVEYIEKQCKVRRDYEKALKEQIDKGYDGNYFKDVLKATIEGESIPGSVQNDSSLIAINPNSQNV